MSRPPNVKARERILTQAYKLMYRSGFKGISMDGVAEGAGLKKANLFHYYPTKEALGMAVFDYAVQGFHEHLTRRLAGSSDPLEMVHAMFEQAVDGMEEQCCAGGCFVGNMAQELSDTSERMRRRVAQHFERWGGHLEAFFTGFKEKGYFRSSFEPAAAAQSVLSLFQGAMLLCKAKRETRPLRHAEAMALAYLKSHRSDSN